MVFEKKPFFIYYLLINKIIYLFIYLFIYSYGIMARKSHHKLLMTVLNSIQEELKYIIQNVQFISSLRYVSRLVGDHQVIQLLSDKT